MIVPIMTPELMKLAERALIASIDDDRDTVFATIEKLNAEFESEGTLGAMMYWARRYRDHMVGDVPSHMRGRIRISPPTLMESVTGRMQSIDDADVPPHIRWGVRFIQLVANTDVHGINDLIQELPDDLDDPMLGNSIWAVCHLAGWSIRNMPRGAGRLGIDPVDEELLSSEPHPVEECCPAVHADGPPPELLAAAEQSWAELTADERAAVHRVGCLGQEDDENDRAIARLFVERAANIVRANRVNADSHLDLPLTVLSPTERELRERLGKPQDILSVGLPADMVPEGTTPQALVQLKDATCIECGVACKVDPEMFTAASNKIICIRCTGQKIAAAQREALGIPDVEHLATEAFEADLVGDRERLKVALDAISELGSDAYFTSFVYWMEIYFDHAADGCEVKYMSLGGFTNADGEKIAPDDERVNPHMLWACRLVVAYGRKDIEEYREILDEIPMTEEGAAQCIYALLHLLTMCKKKFPRGYALMRKENQPPTS